MRIVTDRISPDELCWGLQEQNRLITQADGSTVQHRIQAVYVLRGNAIAEYTTDLGPTALWGTTPELQIRTTTGEDHDTPEDRVGWIRDEANRSRGDMFERELRADVVGSSTLIKDFLQEKEENWKRIHNQSQLGPYQNKQRNGYSRPR